MKPLEKQTADPAIRIERDDNILLSYPNMSTSRHHHSIPPTPAAPARPSNAGKRQKTWVDPASLPYCGDISSITGNAPDYVKQLIYNTYITYGVGNDDCFGSKVGRAVKFVEVNIRRKQDRKDRLEATVVAELEVTKRAPVPPFSWPPVC